ncbi:MAG: response regulator transcription factor [Bifidobacteriaceae bacterium]|nr:response regulator transcription factor [Bifidobacteriaceae bacterium]
MSGDRVAVILADDDPFVTASLATILGAAGDIEVLGTADGAAEAVRLWERTSPDIALLDIQMGLDGGLDAGREILRRDPTARVVFLTTFVDDSYISAALRMGAKGYLVKQRVSAIAPALRSVMAGGSVFGSEVVGRIDGLMGRPPGPRAGLEGLTEREAQIVELVAEGLMNNEIAERVFLSVGTVRNIISAVLAKTGCASRTQLAVWCLRAERGGAPGRDRRPG